MERPEMDIIIVSNGRSPYLRTITKYAVDTCSISSNLIHFNYIIVEQQKKVNYHWPGTQTVHYDFEFNYNRCLNYGLQFAKSKYIALCNNDLEFKYQWAENIIMAMKDNYLSASPADRHYRRRENEPAIYGIEEGYKIAKQLNGWCIVINRKLLDFIGKLDEGVKFWYSDNIYGDQLKSGDIKHILVKHSIVRHLGSRTLRAGKYRDLMRKQYKNYIKARKKYYENRHTNSRMATAKDI